MSEARPKLAERRRVNDRESGDLLLRWRVWWVVADQNEARGEEARTLSLKLKSSLGRKEQSYTSVFRHRYLWLGKVEISQRGARQVTI